jgi:outer membrane protein TolC
MSAVIFFTPAVILAPIVIAGCATYHEMSITPESAESTLGSPDMNEVRIQVSKFKHQLLKPIVFDDRDGLSPAEAAILAVIINPSLKVIRDHNKIAAARLIQAGILPNPKLSYEFGIPVAGDTKDSGNSWGVGLDWDVSSLVSRGPRLDSAKSNLSAAELSVAWQEWQVAEAARLHAHSLLIREKHLQIAQQAEVSAKQWLQTVKSAEESGLKTRQELASAENRAQAAETYLLKIQSELDQERLAFNRTLGIPPQSEITLQNEGDLQLPADLSATVMFELARTNRLDLQAMKLGYQSQENKLRAEIRSQFPKIELGLIGEQDTDGIKSVGAGIKINLPFFDRNQGHIAMERATRRQLFDEYNARLFETRADIARLVTVINAIRRQLILSESALTNQNSLVDSLKIALSNGTADYDTYQAELRSLYRKQSIHIMQQEKLLELGIALEISSGCYGLISAVDISSTTTETSK